MSQFLILPYVIIITSMMMAAAAPVPKGNDRQSGIFVLDNCDPKEKGKLRYEDNLTLLDFSGNKQFRISGFNTCEPVNSPRAIATDRARGCVWVIENSAGRIRRFDFTGRETLEIKGVNGVAIAIDAETGNVWTNDARGGIGNGKTVVFDTLGKQIASYDISGLDIVYDRKSKAFWIVDNKLTKVSAATGKVLSSANVAVWCASSVDVDAETGIVWIAVREHPEVVGSSKRLLKYDTNGKELLAIELKQKDPMSVSINANDGSVWIAYRKNSVERLSAAGKSLAEYSIDPLAIQADPAGDGVWIVTTDDVRKLTNQGVVTSRLAHASKTNTAWITALE